VKKLRIYIDTSVIGGCFDYEFASWSNGLMEDFRSGRYQAVLSDITAAEIEPAGDQIRQLYAELLDIGSEVLQVTEEVLNLATAYSVHGILSNRFKNDMLHIAIATIANVDVVVSWNFRHIVRLDKIRLFNAVNIEMGYRILSIYSPREVTIHGRED